MPPFWVGFFWVGFSKQRKKPGGKSRVHESGPISFKTRFVKFPHRGETKKQPFDRILKFRFHATILGGLFQAAEKAGVTKVVQSRSKRVLLNFPIGGKRKNSLLIEFYNFGFMPPFCVGFSKQRKKPGSLGSKVVQSRSKRVWVKFPRKIGGKRKNSLLIKIFVKLNFGFMPPFCVGFSKQRKKPGWRRSSNCVQNALFQLSLSGRSEKTALGSNFSCHHFGWAFPSSFMPSPRVLLNFPIGGKRKNSLLIEF